MHNLPSVSHTSQRPSSSNLAANEAKKPLVQTGSFSGTRAAIVDPKKNSVTARAKAAEAKFLARMTSQQKLITDRKVIDVTARSSEGKKTLGNEKLERTIIGQLLKPDKKTDDLKGGQQADVSSTQISSKISDSLKDNADDKPSAKRRSFEAQIAGDTEINKATVKYHAEYRSFLEAARKEHPAVRTAGQPATSAPKTLETATKKPLTELIASVINHENALKEGFKQLRSDAASVVAKDEAMKELVSRAASASERPITPRSEAGESQDVTDRATESPVSRKESFSRTSSGSSLAISSDDEESVDGSIESNGSPLTSLDKLDRNPNIRISTWRNVSGKEAARRAAEDKSQA